MRSLKITFFLLLSISFTSYSIAQISRVCTDITPAFISANVNDCTLTADVFDAQGQGPENFTYTWRIDGQIIPNPSPEHMLVYSFDEAGTHNVTAVLRLVSRPSCVNSVSYVFNIEEACEPSDDGNNTDITIITDGDGNDETGNNNCPNVDDIHFINEGGGGLCTTGQASISGLSNVDFVDWTWALGGYSGEINNAGTTTPIYYPSGDWTGSDISICATVVFNDNTVCEVICKNFSLNCGSDNGNPIGRDLMEKNADFKLYPNPARELFNVQFPKENNFKKMRINRFDGTLVKEIIGLTKEVLIDDLPKGVYFIQLISESEKSVIKKLIIM